MGKPSQIVQVYNNARATLSTGAPAGEKISTGWPVGDLLLKAIQLRIRTVSSAAAALVTDGRFKHLTSLYLQTDKHGPIIEGLDGVSLRTISRILNPKGIGSHTMPATVVADTDAYFDLPLADLQAIRPEDTALDMYQARPTMDLSFGAASLLDTGAGVTLDNLDFDVHAETFPAPVEKPDQDGPSVMPHWGIIKYPVTSTTTGLQIPIPYGDRIYKRIYVCQRNGSTLAELNNTVAGVAKSDKISLVVNGFRWFDRMTWHQLQARNRMDYPRYRTDLDASGVAVLDFTKERAGGPKLSDGLSVMDDKQGTAYIEIDATSVSNGQLWVLLESVKPIPQAARRAAPAAAKA